MNKILLWIKNIILIITIMLNIIIFIKWNFMFLLLLLLLIILILSIIDIIKKKEIITDFMYNIISILCFTAILLVLVRYYDPNINLLLNNGVDFYDYFIPFLKQNTILFIILIFSLILYHFINSYKYNK